MPIRRGRHPDMNLNDVDYSVTYQLCQNFDVDRSWEQLAGIVGYSTKQIQMFDLAMQRPDGSPSKKLLWDWGTRGGTVRDLYNKLALLNNAQNMRLLENIMKEDNGDESKASKDCSLSKDGKDCSLTKESKDSLMSKEDNREQRQDDFVSASDSLLGMFPGSGSSGGYNPNSLPIPSMKKCVPPVGDGSVDVNINLPGGKSDKSSDKQFKKVLGVVTEQGAASMEEHQCHADGPPSSKGNMGAASSHQRSFERVRSVIEEYGTETSYMSQLSQDEREIARALMSTPHYTYKELSQATDGFSMNCRLGQGKFGSVYLGLVKKTKCAIKKLTQKHERNDEDSSSSHLSAELKALSRYRHENIVSLYGYALDGDEVCLVYQYMMNGSLDDCLHCKHGHNIILSWEQRLTILRGAACGLQFLHSVDVKPVVHGDIKSANILLDRHFEAKIGDLGMAQQATGGEATGKYTHVTKKNTCTHDYQNRAYSAPEIKRGNGPSVKGDSFAFGVIMLECLTGQQAYDERREGNLDEKFLVNYIDNQTDSDPKLDRQQAFQDPRLACGYPEAMFTLMFDLAEKCIAEKKKDRPTMVDVYTELEKTEGLCNGPDYKNISEMGISRMSDRCEGAMKPTVLNAKPGFIGDGGCRAPPKSLSLRPPAGHPVQCESASPIDCLPKNQPLPEAYRLQRELDMKMGNKDPDYENVSKLTEDLKNCHIPRSGKLSSIEASDKDLKSFSEKEKMLVQCDIPESDPEKLKDIEEFDKKNIGDGEEMEIDDKISDDKVYASDPKKLAMLAAQDNVVKNGASLEDHEYENVPLVAMEQDELYDAAALEMNKEFEEIATKGSKRDSTMMDIFNRYADLKEDEHLQDFDNFANNENCDDLDFQFDFDADDSESSTITESINNDMDQINSGDINENDLFSPADPIPYDVRMGQYENIENIDVNVVGHHQCMDGCVGRTDGRMGEDGNTEQLTARSHNQSQQGSDLNIGVEQPVLGPPASVGASGSSKFGGNREPSEGDCYV